MDVRVYGFRDLSGDSQVRVRVPVLLPNMAGKRKQCKGL